MSERRWHDWRGSHGGREKMGIGMEMGKKETYLVECLNQIIRDGLHGAVRDAFLVAVQVGTPDHGVDDARDGVRLLRRGRVVALDERGSDLLVIAVVDERAQLLRVLVNFDLVGEEPLFLRAGLVAELGLLVAQQRDGI